MPAPQKVIYEGKVYRSISALARAKNFERGILVQRVRNNWPESEWFMPVVHGARSGLVPKASSIAKARTVDIIQEKLSVLNKKEDDISKKLNSLEEETQWPVLFIELSSVQKKISELKKKLERES